MVKEVSPSALVSVIFGVLSIVLSISVIFGQVAGLAFGIIGLVFALVARKKSKDSWTRWGLALSIIGIALNLIVLVYVYQAVLEVMNQLEQAAAQMEATGAVV